jgi:hypothetical protein
MKCCIRTSPISARDHLKNIKVSDDDRDSVLIEGSLGELEGLGSIGMVVSLVGVNLIQFYIDQFSNVVKAIIQFLILQTMYYYQRRFRV